MRYIVAMYKSFKGNAMNRNEYLRQLAQRQPRAVVATRTEAQEQAGSWQDAAVAAAIAAVALGLLSSLG